MLGRDMAHAVVVADRMRQLTDPRVQAGWRAAAEIAALRRTERAARAARRRQQLVGLLRQVTPATRPAARTDGEAAAAPGMTAA